MTASSAPVTVSVAVDPPYPVVIERGVIHILLVVALAVIVINLLTGRSSSVV